MKLESQLNIIKMVDLKVMPKEQALIISSVLSFPVIHHAFGGLLLENELLQLKLIPC